MKLQLKNTLRTSLCAAALLSAAWAQAQTQQPVPATAAQPSMQHEHQHGHKQPSKTPHHKHSHQHGHKHQHKSDSGKYATPQQHERAAVQQERRQGSGPSNPQGAQLTEFQRNALQRCEIFKTPDDRSACVERVRQPQISGSIEGGGVIREYTQTVRTDVPRPSAETVRPVSPPMSDRTPQPNPHPHMMHPPVQPMRPAQ